MARVVGQFRLPYPAAQREDARGLHDAITASAAGEPGWLAAFDRATAAAAGSHGTLISALLAAAFILIAAGILVPATTRPALNLATTAGLAFWVIGENFGQILTGMATDPNTGPLLILLAAAYWPLRPKASPADPPLIPVHQLINERTSGRADGRGGSIIEDRRDLQGAAGPRHAEGRGVNPAAFGAIPGSRKCVTRVCSTPRRMRSRQSRHPPGDPGGCPRSLPD